MDNNYLKKIEEAENKADQIINKALEEAESLNEKAARELKENQENFAITLENKANEIINEQIKKAEKEAADIIKENLVECEKIKEESKEQIEKAVAFVVEKIGVSKWQ